MPSMASVTRARPPVITRLYPKRATIPALRGAAMICPSAKGRKQSPAANVLNPRSVWKKNGSVKMMPDIAKNARLTAVRLTA